MSDQGVQMVADTSKKTKMVKIKVHHPIRLSDGTTPEVGAIVDVTEADAKEFADRTFTGVFNFEGERSGRGKDERQLLKRAERVAA